MGPEEKAIWEVTYKHGYRMGTLYFYCLSDQVEPMFMAIAKRDFAQSIELFCYELAGELIDYDEYADDIETSL